MCLFLTAFSTVDDEASRLPEPHQRDAMASNSWRTTTPELRLVLGYVNHAISCIAQLPNTQVGPKPDLQNRYGVAQAMYA